MPYLSTGKIRRIHWPPINLPVLSTRAQVGTPCRPACLPDPLLRAHLSCPDCHRAFGNLYVHLRGSTCCRLCHGANTCHRLATSRASPLGDDPSSPRSAAALKNRGTPLSGWMRRRSSDDANATRHLAVALPIGVLLSDPRIVQGRLNLSCLINGPRCDGVLAGRGFRPIERP